MTYILKKRIYGALQALIEAVKVRPVVAICVAVIGAVLLQQHIMHGGRMDAGPPIPDDGSSIEVSGTIQSISISTTTYGGTLLIYISDVCTQDGLSITGHMQRIVAEVSEDEQLHIGQHIEVRGKVAYFMLATNPGEFNAKEFYGNRGIIFKLKKAVITQKGARYSLVKQGLYNLRLRCEGVLTRELSVEDAAIMKAMLLGNKNEIDEDTRELFQKNGISHILAISGLHISFIAMGLYRLLNRCLKIGVKISAFISGGIVILYGIMVGFSPSAFRAICMFGLFLISKMLKRTYDSLTALSVAAILILLSNKGYIFDAAFLLSFSAVSAVIILLPAYSEHVCRVPSWLQPLQMSLAIFLMTFPTVVSCYYEVAFYSIILNIVIIPLMTVLLIMGILLVLAGVLGEAVVLYGCAFLTNTVNTLGLGPIIQFSRKIIEVILYLYKGSCRVLENTGMARINIASPSAWKIVIFYICLYVGCHYAGRLLLYYLGRGRAGKVEDSKGDDELPKVIVRVVSSFFWFAAGIILIVTNYKPGLTVTVADVGQGDGIVIENGTGSTYLVDGGSSSKKDVGNRQLIPLLKYKGVNRIAGVVITHPDEDHMCGIIEILRNSRKENLVIENVYIYSGAAKLKEYDELRQICSEQGIQIRGIREGMSIRDRRMKLDVLYPYEGMRTDNLNDTSLVLGLSYGDFSMLLTGDVEEAGEKWIVGKTDGDFDFDVLKVAHHGSISSTSQKLLEWASPEVAIISVGRDNSYGHPRREVLDRLKDNGCRYFCTMDYGAIEIWTNGQKYRVTGFTD